MVLLKNKQESKKGKDADHKICLWVLGNDVSERVSKRVVFIAQLDCEACLVVRREQLQLLRRSSHQCGKSKIPKNWDSASCHSTLLLFPLDLSRILIFFSHLALALNLFV